ncbi:MAG: hypothetical protein KDC98_19765 [Planctomycetes bacterium]|nr:hypothetical protein [Planctomycetota bacterium]
MIRALIHTWLLLDFFGDARRRGGSGSSLTTTIFTQSFLALVFASLLYPETPPVAFAAANLSLSSLLVTVGLLGDEDRVVRRRADRVLIGTSPIRRSAVVLARGGHAAFYVCLITIGMALPPAILLGFLRHGVIFSLGYIALACACSGLAAGTFAVILRAVARCAGHARATLLGATLKALLLGGGVAMFAIGLQQLRGTAADLPIGRMGAELLPTYQAARLLENPLDESWRLGAMLAAGLLVLGLAVLLGESQAERGVSTRRTGLLDLALRRLAGSGPRLGLADFVATVMWRSPGFRARVLPLLGLPAGMVYLSLHEGTGDKAFVFLCVLLQLPAIYLPFLIAFLPRADQENTRWVFDQAPPVDLELVRDATWRALVTHVLVPVHGMAAAILVPTSGAPLQMATAAVFSLAIAITVARPLCRALPAIPFTDDSGSEPTTDLGSLFPTALGLLAIAIIYGQFLGPVGRVVAAMTAGLFAGAMLLRRPAPSTVPGPADEPQPAQAGQAEATAEQSHGVEQANREASLRGELRAIALLYLAVSAVPLLVGSAFADGG